MQSVLSDRKPDLLWASIIREPSMVCRLRETAPAGVWVSRRRNGSRFSATHRQMRGAFACAIEAAIVGRAPTSAGECPADLLKFSGAEYLFQFGLPNFYFHIVTAYDILRHLGVPVGKLDFLGPLQPA